MCVFPAEAKGTCALANVIAIVQAAYGHCWCVIWVLSSGKLVEPFPVLHPLALLMVLQLFIPYMKSLLAQNTNFLDGNCQIYSDWGKKMNWEMEVHHRNPRCVGLSTRGHDHKVVKLIPWRNILNTLEPNSVGDN